ncbi:MAG: dihydroorotate dehydrogenase electron transfer subunit [bacterium]|nr:dihydroorotate dehydrogenase electron transfer subunit [bacterium]
MTPSPERNVVPVSSTGRVVSVDASSVVVQVPGWPRHRPGQFAMLKLDPDGPHRDPLLPRPMAIYRADGDVVEFRIKIVGRGTRALAELPAGASLRVTGPLGNGFPAPRGSSILVGGGSGIASLFELARDTTPAPTVLLGGRSQADILGLDDFEKLSIDLRIATEDGSLGTRGYVTELLQPEPGEVVYACGPTAMMQRVAEIAQKAGASCRVSLEANMACGFGICLGCVVETRNGFRYVCKDGPVFSAEDVSWEVST